MSEEWKDLSDRDLLIRTATQLEGLDRRLLDENDGCVTRIMVKLDKLNGVNKEILPRLCVVEDRVNLIRRILICLAVASLSGGSAAGILLR